MNNDYYQNWVGIVEERNDPLKLRCRVRIIGVHPISKAQVPTEALPWASISCPPSSMLSLMMPKEGDTVDGYFMHGNPDFPVITGVNKLSYMLISSKMDEISILPPLVTRTNSFI